MYTLLSTKVQKEKSVFTILVWPSLLTLFGFTADLMIQNIMHENALTNHA